MKPCLQYCESPVTYYSRLWRMSEESIEDFIEIYDFNKQIWNYSRFKRWFKLTYNFTLTYKRWRGFKKYNKIYIRRTLLHLEKGVKITSQFIQEALSNR